MTPFISSALPPSVSQIMPDWSVKPLLGRIAVASSTDYRCAIQMMPDDLAEIDTVAPARIGQDAVCYSDLLGVLPGSIAALTARGFHIRLRVNEIRRERIEARLAWHGNGRRYLVDERSSDRIVPKHRETVLTLSDESTLGGLVMDLSKTGVRVAIKGSRKPQLGSTVAVGKRYATVIRIDDATIAAVFRLPFTDETFNHAVIL